MLSSNSSATRSKELRLPTTPVSASCSPPVPESGQLTVGTADANGQQPKFVGVARYAALPGTSGNPADDADATLTLDLKDVRRKSDLGDYTGEVQVNTTVRITDKSNGPSVTEPLFDL